jgi:ATP-dependent Lon protease
MELDRLDRLAASAFDGYIVRKDLVRRFKGQYPVPTYVVEFLLGRYCASIDESEIQEGLEIVERQMGERTVRAGEEELFKAHARERGAVKVIDNLTARLDAANDAYVASLPSLRLSDVRIDSETVVSHQRMLTGGFYAEVELEYDAAMAQEKAGRPFGIRSLKPIQLSKRDVLIDLSHGRSRLATADWKRLLLRSVGLEPDQLTERAQDIMLLRMVPFVERNYNAVELGPRGTGKSHLFQQVSPYAHLVSGGKASVARMFVNNATGQRGLVCQYDVVCFDEVSGVSFDQKDGVNIMKGYMESGEFSRGRESIRGDGGIMMVGNFDVDVEHQQRVGHLFSPMPPEMRDDTALMDRVHAYLPGWDLPKLNAAFFTDHYGLVSDFLSECWTRLRSQTRVSAIHGRVDYGGALSGRDTTAVNRTVSGLLKLLNPDAEAAVSDEDIEWAVRLAMECRRRVKEQQKRVGAAEFRNTQFSYRLGADGVETFVSTSELQGAEGIGLDPLPPGQAWGISPGGAEESPALYRIEVNEAAGSGMRITNVSPPASLKESVQTAYQNLLANNKELIGDRDARQHELHIQVRAMDVAKGASMLGLPVLLAFCSALLAKSLKGGLILVGGLSVGGSFEPIHNAVHVVELAVEKGAQSIMLPVATRRQLNDLSDEMAAKINIVYYLDIRDALLKALLG